MNSILFEPFVYWGILIVWIFVSWKFKTGASTSFFVAVTLLFISFLILIAGFFSIGERVARVSFTLLLVGFIQALLEYRKNH